MHKPLISVILPVYNGEQYLVEAIESILFQTLQDFELIIINDGSTDKSLDIIKYYAMQHTMIYVINRENKGLVASLNEGIAYAKGKYIARMDQDDISLPTRFEKQVDLMEKENLDICGCHFFMINESTNYIDARVVSCDQKLNQLILARAVPFAHGSIIIRKSFLANKCLEYGQTKYAKAEDYALWTTCAEKGAKISNVNDFLFKYRHIEGTLSKEKINRKHALNISKEYIIKNSTLLFSIIENYSAKKLNIFESENVSYFLLKTVLCKDFMKKIKILKNISMRINIINIIRILTCR